MRQRAEMAEASAAALQALFEQPRQGGNQEAGTAALPQAREQNVASRQQAQGSLEEERRGQEEERQFRARLLAAEVALEESREAERGLRARLAQV